MHHPICYQLIESNLIDINKSTRFSLTFFNFAYLQEDASDFYSLKEEVSLFIYIQLGGRAISGLPSLLYFFCFDFKNTD